MLIIKNNFLKLIFVVFLILKVEPLYWQPGIETFSSKQCLVANLYFEARGESVKGMKAVAATTYNRLDHRNYPETLCKVVFQKKQFSWTWQKNPETILKILRGSVEDLQPKDLESYKKAVDIASLPRVHFLQTLPKNVVFYHSVKVKPYWSKYKIQVAKIGSHIFYRS